MTATFDDLIRLKLRREEQRNSTTEIDVPSLGKPLSFNAPTRDQQLDFIGAVRKSGSIDGSYEAYRRLVYDCCPTLHSKQLLDECGAVDPYDVVDILLPPLEVIFLGDEIANKFFTVADDVKN